MGAGAERSLAIQLGPTRRPGLPLTAQLARALADPALELRYRVPDVGWLNEQGRQVPAPEASQRLTRAPTPGGGEVVLVHGQTAIGDSGSRRRPRTQLRSRSRQPVSTPR